MALAPTEILRSGRLTYADYCNFPDDGIRRELIDGEVVVVTPAPNVRHQDVVGNLYFVFRAYLRTQGGGRVFLAPCDVVLSDEAVVQPDLVFVEQAAAGIITDANIAGVPTLLVEVVSDSRADRVRKRDLYAAAGVGEYWVVDPGAEWVEVYRPSAGGAYAKPQLYQVGETVAPRALPNLTISVGDLFSV